MLRYNRVEVYFREEDKQRVHDVATMLGKSVAQYCRDAVLAQVAADEKVNRHYLDSLHELRKKHVIREG